MKPAFRPLELFLLLPGWLFLAVAQLQVALADEARATLADLVPALAFALGLLFAHLALSLAGFRGDQLLLPLVAMGAAVGLAFIHRVASPDLALRQSIWFSLGLAAMLGTMALARDLSWLRRYRYSWAVAGLLVMAATLVLGQGSSPGGPRLWINFGLFQFQPSEIFKVLLVVFFAVYLDDYREILARGRTRVGPLTLPPLPHLLPMTAMLGLSLVLLVVQRDLGAALLYLAVFLAMLYLGSGQVLYVLAGGAGFAVIAYGAARWVEIVQTRVAIWLDPFADPSASGYQVVQALIALAAGGVLGQGLGQGLPTVIPAVHTDFVLAGVGEELGLVGSLGVVTLYMLMVGRGLHIAVEAPTGFLQLLAGGLTAALAIQTLVIMGGNLRLLPLTGITLPFMSYGGSSMLTNFVAVGLLLRISGLSARRV